MSGRKQVFPAESQEESTERKYNKIINRISRKQSVRGKKKERRRLPATAFAAGGSRLQNKTAGEEESGCEEEVDEQ